MHTVLEQFAGTLRYADLPEIWRPVDVAAFSRQKTLYDYQQTAFKNAACLLHEYYAGGADAAARKASWAAHYAANDCDLSQFDYPRSTTRRRLTESAVYKILSRAIAPRDDAIRFQDLINRMSFWMATGSGKTLVMIKLIELLARLMESGAIPKRGILVLAPRDDLLEQIKRTIDEFNYAAEPDRLFLSWVSLRQYGNEPPSLAFGDATPVYFYRADNIAEERGDARIDYREFENDGKWYVLLDEAHKGGKEDSKRQAYYSLLARDGFLFNFSATFTDAVDVATTACKYNLEDFIRDGYGKHILLSRDGFASFRKGAAAFRKDDDDEIDSVRREKILLKSLITLAAAKLRVREIRDRAGRDDVYHEPLMMTLVNSVGIDLKNNDLWAFFDVLRRLASGGIDDAQFKQAKQELSEEWSRPDVLFERPDTFSLGDGVLKSVTAEKLRATVFHSPKKSELTAIVPSNKKEIAFQLKGADTPFAALRIGDIVRWKNEFLSGIEIQKTTLRGSFFEDLDDGRISILMGSRAFIEGWDSNRPNVINLINIGVGKKAQKFVTQAIGRGVRIAPLPGRTRRRAARLPTDEKRDLGGASTLAAVPETVFIYATNRGAVEAVISGLQTQLSAGAWSSLEDCFERQSAPLLDGEAAPLIRPEYRHTKTLLAQTSPFLMNDETVERLRGYLKQTSDAALIVSRGLTPTDVSNLRAAAKPAAKTISTDTDKFYASLRFLLRRLTKHLRLREKTVSAMRTLSDEDIVHFRRVETSYEGATLEALREKIKGVGKSARLAEILAELEGMRKRRNIDAQEYVEKVGKIGKPYEEFDNFSIRHIAAHYYTPLVYTGIETETRIRHAIRSASEKQFIDNLDKWLEKQKFEEQKVDWDGWMFSKLDDACDKIYIPYFDGSQNECRRFYPDFIFWMWRGNDYRIAFVDPKGVQHTAHQHKIDGYARLFEENGARRSFVFTDSGRKWRVEVELLLFRSQDDGAPPARYKQYWHSSPSKIFAAGAKA